MINSTGNIAAFAPNRRCLLTGRYRLLQGAGASLKLPAFWLSELFDILPLSGEKIIALTSNKSMLELNGAHGKSPTGDEVSLRGEVVKHALTKDTTHDIQALLPITFIGSVTQSDEEQDRPVMSIHLVICRWVESRTANSAMIRTSSDLMS